VRQRIDRVVVKVTPTVAVAKRAVQCRGGVRQRNRDATCCQSVNFSPQGFEQSCGRLAGWREQRHVERSVGLRLQHGEQPRNGAGFSGPGAARDHTQALP